MQSNRANSQYLHYKNEKRSHEKLKKRKFCLNNLCSVVRRVLSVATVRRTRKVNTAQFRTKVLVSFYSSTELNFLWHVVCFKCSKSFHKKKHSFESSVLSIITEHIFVSSEIDLAEEVKDETLMTAEKNISWRSLEFHFKVFFMRWGDGVESQDVNRNL